MANHAYGPTAQRSYRFYLVLDVSGSMDDKRAYPHGTPFKRLQQVLPALLTKLMREPTLAGRTYVSVITFHTTARVLLPSVLTDDFRRVDDLTVGVFTDYVNAFE